ncbi:hypothetical protein [Streptomyces hygroscopicus]|uniref:hypothetical protein n=1 Tax=Streptomyces hygroscopicus TaxID=1912 RepID=UPI001FCB0025|nr:hypothetical protein [Streptomyces hygroscopicus]
MKKNVGLSGVPLEPPPGTLPEVSPEAFAAASNGALRVVRAASVLVPSVVNMGPDGHSK